MLCWLSFLSVIVKLALTPFEGYCGSGMVVRFAVIVAFAGVGGL